MFDEIRQKLLFISRQRLVGIQYKNKNIRMQKIFLDKTFPCKNSFVQSRRVHENTIRFPWLNFKINIDPNYGSLAELVNGVPVGSGSTYFNCRYGEEAIGFCRLERFDAGLIFVLSLFVLRGDFAQNTRDMNLVLTTTLYAADKEDAALIEEESVRELFVLTMEKLEETQSNYRFAGSGWRNLEEHYENHFDVITIDTTGHLYIDYAVERGFKEGIEAEQEADRMSAVIVSSLFADNLGTYLQIYGASFLNGLINTVAKRSSLLDWYALLAYIAYIALMIACLCKKEKRQAGFVAYFVLLAILVNVGVAAALIFCQTRYMIYNMALFYVAGIVMLWELLKKPEKNGEAKSEK